jgi:hypothetical protein
MSRKAVLLSVLAVAVIMVFLAASAVAVFALAVQDSAQVEAAPVEDTLQIAPVQVEVSPKAVEPAINVERASYSDYSGGCPFSHSKVQLTQAPAEKLEDAPLAQADLN